MSYKDSKPVQLGGDKGTFSGGYVDNTQNLYLSESSSPYLRNARLDGNSTIIRPGYSLFATLTTGSYPKGIGSYLRKDSDDDVLVVRHNQDTNKKLVTIDEDGVITAIDTSTDIASDNRMNFINVGDVIYCMNGVDKFGKLDGTTYTTPYPGISARPRFGVIFNGCLWTSGYAPVGEQVMKSVADDYEDWTGAGSDSFKFQEAVTGLAANIGSLFYFTKNTISVTGANDIQDVGGVLTYFTRALTVKEGAMNNECIVSVGNRTYYLSSSNKINIITPGQSAEGYETISISDRKYNGISEIMKTLSKDQTDGFAHYYPEKNLIIWNLKSDGATFNDTPIVYDINKDKFLVDSKKYYYGEVYFKGYNYSISMIEPKVFLSEYGQDDEDSPIPFEYRTKAFYFDDPTFKKVLWESRTLLDINELAELTQEIRKDGVLFDTKTIDKDNIDITFGGIGSLPIGEYAIGEEGEEGTDYHETYILRTKGTLNTRGKKFQFRFTNDSLAGKVRLKHIQVRIEQLPGLTSNLTT